MEGGIYRSAFLILFRDLHFHWTVEALTQWQNHNYLGRPNEQRENLWSGSMDVPEQSTVPQRGRQEWGELLLRSWGKFFPSKTQAQTGLVNWLLGRKGLHIWRPTLREGSLGSPLSRLGNPLRVHAYRVCSRLGKDEQSACSNVPSFSSSTIYWKWEVMTPRK